MGKRFIFAIVLSMLVMMVWSRLFPPPKPAFIPTPAEQPLSYPTKEEQELKIRPQGELSLPEGARDIEVTTNLFKITFTTSGGRIKSCRLRRYEEMGLNRKDIERELGRTREEHQRAIFQQLLVHSEKRDEKIGGLEEFGLAADQGTELVSIEADLWKDYPFTISLDDEEKNKALNSAIYEPSKERLVVEEKEETLIFTSPLIGEFRVDKRFTFSPEAYTIGVEVVIKKETSGAPPEGSFMLGYGPGIGFPDVSGVRRYGYRGPITLIRGEPSDVLIKEKYGRAEAGRPLRRIHQGQVQWTAIKNKYFVAALVPEGKVQAAVVDRDEYGVHKVALNVPFAGTPVHRFKLYLGPKEEARLKDLGVGLERVIEYGFFGPIAKGIAVCLDFFHSWTNNYGWAIVLLALSIKVAFYPLTHRSFEAMQKMQKDMKRLQPELDELKRKYGSNPQKLQKEQMGLYRKRGVNPLAGCKGGCFPMLLQMPVFFALYVVLYNSIELRGAGFLGWIDDLSSKDPYYILPILMGVSMLVQQKLTGMGGGASASSQQQATMMMWMMPILFTWIFATLPSGVVLYWLVFNVFTGLQQVLIKRKGASQA